MTDHLKTIREALEAAGVAKLADGTYLDKHCQITMALTALDALEAAMKTPVAEVAPDGVLRFWTTARKFEVGSKLYMDAPPAQQTNEWREAVLDKLAEHCIDAPIDEPPASILGRIIEVAVQMATDPRINPPAQQAQRPDFHDEWAGYLKDGETPFERFTRERKDLTSLTKLYQRALEENERLKAQQPQAEAVPSTMSQPNRLVAYSAAAKLRELGYQWDERTEAWAPQQVESVPPDVTDAMVDAYLQANDAYWRETDAQPKSPVRWRNGNPKEATRMSLAAAIAAAPKGHQHD